MKRLLILVVLAAGLLPATGCGLIRRTEQWKCDNLGLCFFGMQPSNGPPVGYEQGFSVEGGGPVVDHYPPAGY